MSGQGSCPSDDVNLGRPRVNELEFEGELKIKNTFLEFLRGCLGEWESSKNVSNRSKDA